MSEREEWINLIRNEYDPKPDLGKGSYPAFDAEWDDGAGRIADAILADKVLLIRQFQQTHQNVGPSVEKIEELTDTRTVHDPFLGKDVQVSDRLVDRLRGKYASGPHLPNGNPEFGWRQFQAPPIQHEAAAEIERLRGILEEIATFTSDPVAEHAAREGLTGTVVHS